MSAESELNDAIKKFVDEKNKQLQDAQMKVCGIRIDFHENPFSQEMVFIGFSFDAKRIMDIRDKKS